ncbi:hypothetical protein DXG03_001230 [Asterophora parasitica]|uniref:Uncharacterized protein n=1 Tax=Asterophora parasitica TaxID=117018 RepID=A0A9P7KAF5_9AGAR|nr:hypothetical protein DXG03_001230 [Asterophora parasitica]
MMGARLVVSFVLSVVFLFISAKNVRILKYEDLVKLFPGLQNVGCKAARPPHFWRIYVPSLVLHVCALYQI